METLYTTLEVADILKVHPKTLARWRREGTGPKTINIGGLVRYPQSSLEQYLTEAKVATE